MNSAPPCQLSGFQDTRSRRPRIIRRLGITLARCRFWLAGLALLGLVDGWLPAAVIGRSALEGTPTLVLAELTQHVDLFPGQTDTVAFMLVAPADQSITLTQVERNCGCLDSDAAPGVLAAGSQTAFRIQVRGDQRPGTRVVRTRLLGQQGATVIAYHCSIEVEVREPLVSDAGWRMVDLPGITGSLTMSKLTIPLRRGSHPEQWESLTAEVTGIGGQWSATPEVKDDQIDLRLGFIPDQVSGIMTATVRFSLFTSGRELPCHPKLPLRVRVSGEVQTIPGSVLFGAVPLDGVRDESIELVSAGTGPIPEITSITSSDSQRLGAQALANGQRRGIRFSFRGVGLPGAASGWAEVRFADEARTRLRLPYYATVSAPPARTLTGQGPPLPSDPSRDRDVPPR